MAGSRRFLVDSGRVVHETIDGETILIDLHSGTYYSLRGCGSRVWDLLVRGWSDDEVVDEVRRQYDADPAVVADAVYTLVAELASEQLLDPVCDSQNTSVAPAEDRAPNSDTTAEPFARPVLAKYTDMQYFLLLDPIHDVAAAGWPNARRESLPEAVRPA
jgi:hypothetical protein